MKLWDLVKWLDGFLEAGQYQDRSLNGLQVEGSPEVHRIACAVDTSIAGIEQAVAGGAQLLLVHHGLFWGHPLPIVRAHRTRIQRMLQSGLSLYAAHLPLDAHPQVGNNAVLIRGVGVADPEPFGRFGGQPVGLQGTLSHPMTVDLFAARLTQVVGGGAPLHLGRGPERIERVGVITGAAARSVEDAARAGLDAFVTGETDHASYHLPAELGIHAFFAGHYQTETLGPRALAAHVSEVHGLEHFFIDIPTGL